MLKVVDKNNNVIGTVIYMNPANGFYYVRYNDGTEGSFLESSGNNIVAD